MQNKQALIDSLTGVNSSKNNYYSELKQTVSALENKNTKLSMINNVTKGFHVAMPMEEMLEMVLQSLDQLYPVARISLSLLYDDSLQLTQVYPPDTEVFPVGTTFTKGASVYWEAVHARTPVHMLVADMPSKYAEKRAFEALDLIFTVSLPLYSRGTTLGVLNIAGKEAVESETLDLPFLQQLADQLAVHIENSRLYTQVLKGKQEWEASFSAVQDMLIITDQEGFVTRTNPAAADMLLQSVPDKKPVHITQLFSHVRVETRLAQRLDERLTIQERVCDVSSAPVPHAENGVSGIVFSIKDRTEQLQLEAQLIQSGKMAAMGEMAAGVAHELNSPLTAVIGNSQLLLRDTQTESPEHQLLTDIKNCGDRCRNIVRNLLTFARQDEYTMTSTSLNHAVQQALSLLYYQIERSQIHIETDFAPSLPDFHGNSQEIEQIIINLLMNARDALEESTVSEKRLTLRTFEKNDELHVTVTDNAGGIPPDRIESIFFPFFTTKEVSKGTGLGLSVSLGIAKEHGGTLRVVQSSAEGSTFQLTLPAEREEHHD
ncbi:ATP-binding protein [Alkalicoccus luteus]|uniref:histidine kinase n=1 Tax=Alkalicoccus luteus TaxID=1237094 RepID=A0A969PL30_9BACI|nr:ATP-binding protein [Alkalicoccus luteus]NJP36176.1 GAF domain-containing protein [Alkalicoccus luteus]